MMEDFQNWGLSPIDRRKTGRRESDLILLQRSRQLEAVRRISHILFQHADIDALIEAALRVAVDEVAARAGSILLAEPESKQLVFRYCLGDMPVPRGTAIPWDQGIAGKVFQTGVAAVINDVKHTSDHFSSIDRATGFVSHDMISLPLKQWKGDPIGVMNVLNKREGILDKNDLDILEIIGAFSALAIQQARLFEEAKLAEVARVLGNISHDIKNLLQPVVSGVWLLKGEIDSVFSHWRTKEHLRGGGYSEAVTSIEQAGARIGELTGGRLTGRVYPEIRELLRTIETGTALLKEAFHEALSGSGGCDEEKAYATCEDALAMIERTSERIHGRVKEIADCMKGLSAPPRFAPCRIVDVVNEVFATLKVLAKEKAIKLATKELDGLPTVQADEKRLYNALYNLVNNAIPEVPSGGSITVSGRMDAEKGAIILSVADTGKGMSPDVRESLFTYAAMSTKPGGSGIGMKIVKDVVDAHHGRISVESEIGKGTTFHIWIPLALRPPGPMQT